MLIVGAGVVGLVLAQALKKVHKTFRSINPAKLMRSQRKEFRSKSSIETLMLIAVVTAGESLFIGRSRLLKTVFQNTFTIV